MYTVVEMHPVYFNELFTQQLASKLIQMLKVDELIKNKHQIKYQFPTLSFM